MSKQILVFGAGKSATCLIGYLITEAKKNDWLLTVADNNLALAASKTAGHEQARAVAVNVENTEERKTIIQAADIVISLLPPTLHFLVAKDCVLFGKSLLTASYTDDNMRSLEPEIRNKKLLFLCEMGLDPGIDHMSAMQLIHRIQQEGGTVNSFISHCGGLVAPESDDNPWHYKISWNPRNVVMAGKAGAVYRQNNEVKELPYQALFDETCVTTVPGIGKLAWYPNRDSNEYIRLYKLDTASTFIRTTLRYPEFCAGWRTLIALQLTAENIFYDTNGMSLQRFFKQHFENIGYTTARENAKPAFFVEQLNWLGRNDDNTLINKGRCSAMEVLQFALETKLLLQAHDKDMIVMLHEIEFEQQGKRQEIKSHLIVKGTDNSNTGMAKTVGLPLGIAAKLILQGKIKETGLHIPIIPSIYEPVLAALQEHAIVFHESTTIIQ